VWRQRSRIGAATAGIGADALIFIVSRARRMASAGSSSIYRGGRLDDRTPPPRNGARRFAVRHGHLSVLPDNSCWFLAADFDEGERRAIPLRQRWRRDEPKGSEYSLTATTFGLRAMSASRALDLGADPTAAPNSRRVSEHNDLSTQYAPVRVVRTAPLEFLMCRRLQRCDTARRGGWRYDQTIV
jgi:hypothetical protein